MLEAESSYFIDEKYILKKNCCKILLLGNFRALETSYNSSISLKLECIGIRLNILEILIKKEFYLALVERLKESFLITLN